MSNLCDDFLINIPYKTLNDKFYLKIIILYHYFTIDRETIKIYSYYKVKKKKHCKLAVQ